MSMIRATIVGGIVFLVPVGILLLVLSEVMALVLLVADPVAEVFGVDDFLGVAAANVIALVALVVLCFLAGLAARSMVLSKQMNRLDQVFQGVLPGYMMVKTLVAGATSQTDAAITRKVVRVAVAGGVRFGFEIERNEATGEVIVFLPSTPDPGAGTVMSVSSEVVSDTDLPASKVLRAMRFYGRGLT